LLNKKKEPGYHQISFNGKNLQSEVYIDLSAAVNCSQVKKWYGKKNY